MTLNELGALCMGRELDPRHPGWMKALDSERAFPCKSEWENTPCPDISLSDPHTDAQIANVWRLKKRAHETDRDAFARVLWENFQAQHDREEMVSVSEQKRTFHPSLEDWRDAAIEVLCPEEHRGAWNAMKEAM